MTMARAHLVDVSVTRWYHCITRCVRRAFLLGEEPIIARYGSKNDCRNLRKSSRSRSAGSRCSIIICTCSCALTLTRRPTGPTRKSSGAGAGFFRRATSHASRCRSPKIGSQWRLKDAAWVAKARERLQSLSWFMKCLKEPLARLANRQDKVARSVFRGTLQERGNPR